MGCWNGTCGLSNLHIRNGQDVMVFALVKNNGIDSLCYTTPFYAPVLLPFYAKYNDYGGGEDCSGAALNLIMDGIREHLVELPIGKNQYHDIAVKKADFGPDLFFEAVHENRLFVKGVYERSREHVNFVMMHMDVVNYILENRKIERYVGANNGNTGWDNAYIEINFADVIADIPECVDFMFSNISDESNPLRFFEPMRSLRKLNKEDTRKANAAAGLLSHEDYRFSNLVSLSDQVMLHHKENNRDGLIELLTDYLKGLWIDGFMLDTRKFWSPQAGAGSQAQEADGYRILVSAITEVLDAEQREWDEENED